MAPTTTSPFDSKLTFIIETFLGITTSHAVSKALQAEMCTTYEHFRCLNPFDVLGYEYEATAATPSTPAVYKSLPRGHSSGMAAAIAFALQFEDNNQDVEAADPNLWDKLAFGKWRQGGYQTYSNSKGVSTTTINSPSAPTPVTGIATTTTHNQNPLS